MDYLSRIKAYTFDKTSTGGYNTQQVDSFMENLLDIVYLLREKNTELTDKIVLLETQKTMIGKKEAMRLTH